MIAPAALLLDLDGTLVDSEPRHIRAHLRFLAGVGLAVTEADCLANIGKGDRSFYRLLRERAGRTDGDPDEWVEGKTDVLIDLYRTEGLPLQPGVTALLDRAWRAGIPCQVVTSAERRLAVAALEATGLSQRLPARVCFEDVTRPKPNPDPYLLAARRLGLPPSRCWVIEDSVTGATAGMAAGCVTWAVAGLVPADRLADTGARVVNSIDQVVWA